MFVEWTIVRRRTHADSKKCDKIKIIIVDVWSSHKRVYREEKQKGKEKEKDRQSREKRIGWIVVAGGKQQKEKENSTNAVIVYIWNWFHACWLHFKSPVAYVCLVVVLCSIVADRREMAKFVIFSLLLCGVCFATIKTGIWSIFFFLVCFQCFVHWPSIYLFYRSSLNEIQFRPLCLSSHTPTLG